MYLICVCIIFIVNFDLQLIQKIFSMRFVRE